MYPPLDDQMVVVKTVSWQSHRPACQAVLGPVLQTKSKGRWLLGSPKTLGEGTELTKFTIIKSISDRGPNQDEDSARVLSESSTHS